MFSIPINLFFSFLGVAESINVGRIGPREIDRLIKTVDPPTCRLVV
jgi:hypothetical protein